MPQKYVHFCSICTRKTPRLRDHLNSNHGGLGSDEINRLVESAVNQAVEVLNKALVLDLDVLAENGVLSTTSSVETIDAFKKYQEYLGGHYREGTDVERAVIDAGRRGQYDRSDGEIVVDHRLTNASIVNVKSDDIESVKRTIVSEVDPRSDLNSIGWDRWDGIDGVDESNLGDVNTDGFDHANSNTLDEVVCGVDADGLASLGVDCIGSSSDKLDGTSVSASKDAGDSKSRWDRVDETNLGDVKTDGFDHASSNTLDEVVGGVDADGLASLGVDCIGSSSDKIDGTSVSASKDADDSKSSSGTGGSSKTGVSGSDSGSGKPSIHKLQKGIFHNDSEDEFSDKLGPDQYIRRNIKRRQVKTNKHAPPVSVFRDVKIDLEATESSASELDDESMLEVKVDGTFKLKKGTPANRNWKCPVRAKVIETGLNRKLDQHDQFICKFVENFINRKVDFCNKTPYIYHGIASKIGHFMSITDENPNPKNLDTNTFPDVTKFEEYLKKLTDAGMQASSKAKYAKVYRDMLQMILDEQGYEIRCQRKCRLYRFAIARMKTVLKCLYCAEVRGTQKKMTERARNVNDELSYHDAMSIFSDDKLRTKAEELVNNFDEALVKYGMRRQAGISFVTRYCMMIVIFGATQRSGVCESMRLYEFDRAIKQGNYYTVYVDVHKTMDAGAVTLVLSHRDYQIFLGYRKKLRQKWGSVHRNKISKKVRATLPDKSSDELIEVTVKKAVYDKEPFFLNTLGNPICSGSNELSKFQVITGHAHITSTDLRSACETAIKASTKLDFSEKKGLTESLSHTQSTADRNYTVKHSSTAIRIHNQRLQLGRVGKDASSSSEAEADVQSPDPPTSDPSSSDCPVVETNDKSTYHICKDQFIAWYETKKRSFTDIENKIRSNKTPNWSKIHISTFVALIAKARRLLPLTDEEFKRYKTRAPGKKHIKVPRVSASEGQAESSGRSEDKPGDVPSTPKKGKSVNSAGIKSKVIYGDSSSDDETINQVRSPPINLRKRKRCEVNYAESDSPDSVYSDLEIVKGSKIAKFTDPTSSPDSSADENTMAKEIYNKLVPKFQRKQIRQRSIFPFIKDCTESQRNNVVKLVQELWRQDYLARRSATFIARCMERQGMSHEEAVIEDRLTKSGKKIDINKHLNIQQ